VDDVERERRAVDRRQADAVDGDRVARGGGRRRVDDEPAPVEADDAPDLADDPREHAAGLLAVRELFHRLADDPLEVAAFTRERVPERHQQLADGSPLARSELVRADLLDSLP